MSKKLEHIEILDNGIVHYDSARAKFTPEEIERLNKEYYDNEYSHIPKILEDGFIEFPLLYDGNEHPIWSSCYLPPEFIPSCTPNFEEIYGLKYNIFIPSYNRAGITLTDKMLDRFGIENYYFCIDPSQYPEYSKVYDRKHIIIRDPSFKNESKLDLVTSIDTPDYLHGASGVFNSLLYISKSLGEEAYWTFDDDIFGMGLKARKGDKPATNEKYDKDNYYRASDIDPNIVDFSLKELMNDMMTLFSKMRNQSFYSLEKYGLVFSLPISHKLGTRSYSCYLTNNRNQIPHAGNQNNDILTSLSMSKHGFVNAIFEGFQYNSADTQVLKGGATETYKVNGTLDKGKVLVQAHPNYAKIAVLYSRVHHFVDFNSYNKMRMLGAVKKEV